MSQEPVHGNLSHAMRDNYAEHGVDQYYQKVASTYRNPFFPGIKKVVWTFMTSWWEAEGREMFAEERNGGLRILDMAAGSGEATICLLEWEAAGKVPIGTQAVEKPNGIATPSASAGPSTSRAFIPPNARRAAQSRTLFASSPPILPKSFHLDIVATDPYTSPAYSARTSRTCHPLSFSDLADGQLPAQSNADDGMIYDLIICSFALHLLTEPSELFALLYELSTKCRWLAVLAPHKKPEIKDGWGWERWDLKNWNRAGEAVYAGGRGGDEEAESELEIVRDKVKLRLYRSVNAGYS